MSSTVVPLLLAGGLAAVHVFAGELRTLRAVPRSRLLSLSGGASVAYVFVHLLPELAERQSHALAVEAADAGIATAGERVLFVAALAGFAGFYGLEQLVQQSRREVDRRAIVGGRVGTESRTSAGAFWLLVGAFAAYNALVGYLTRIPEPFVDLFFAFLAGGIILNVIKEELPEERRSRFRAFGAGAALYTAVLLLV